MLSGVSNSKSTDFAQSVKENLKTSTQKSARDFAGDMVLAKKGEAAYMPQMDLDGDGEITFEEFSDFCDEHSISEGARAELMQAMMKARLIKSIEKPEENEEDKEEKEEDEDKEKKEDEEISYDDYLKSVNDKLQSLETSGKNASEGQQSKDLKTKNMLNAYFSNKISASSASGIGINEEI